MVSLDDRSKPPFYPTKRQARRRWCAISGVVLALCCFIPVEPASAAQGAGGAGIVRPLEYQHIETESLSFDLPVDWQWLRGDSRSKHTILLAASPGGDALSISVLPVPPQAGFSAEHVQMGMSALLAGELDRRRGRPRQGAAAAAQFKESYATTVTMDPEPIRKHFIEGFRSVYDIRLTGYEQQGQIAVFKLGDNWILVRCITVTNAGRLAFSHLLETLEFAP